MVSTQNVLPCISAFLFVAAVSDLARGRQVFDLTHTLDSGTPQWPLDVNFSEVKTFESRQLMAEYFPGNMWLAVRAVEFYEHVGTHIDAPSHFGNGKAAVHEINPERFIGPGVVIDVRDKVENNPDYAVTVQDIKEHEAVYGKINPGSIVIMNSGWGKYYPDSKAVFGTDDVMNSSTFHFPGFSLDACKMLMTERQIFVVGVDTPSGDPAQVPGPGVPYPCHVLLLTNGAVIIEYVANLDSIPPRNTTIVIGTPKFRDSTGSPSRILAFIDDIEDKENVSQSSSVKACLTLIVSLCIFVYL